MSEMDSKAKVTDEVTAVLTKGPEPKKRTAKKAAAAKAYDGPEWPYGEDDYLYAEVVSRRGRSEPKYVAAVQQALGIAADGVYGDDTRDAVSDHQHENGLPVSGVVDRATWESILG